MRTTVRWTAAIGAGLSLVLTITSMVMAYLAVRHDTTFNIRDAFLAVFGLLLVMAINT